MLFLGDLSQRVKEQAKKSLIALMDCQLDNKTRDKINTNSHTMNKLNELRHKITNFS